MFHVSLRNMCLYSVIKWEICNKSHKCTHKLLNTILNKGKMSSIPFWICIGPLLMNLLYGSKIQYGHQHRKKMWPGQSGIFMMTIFSETTEPFKCWFAWNDRIFFFVVLCKGYVFLHQSEITDDCPCLTLFDIGNISKKELTQKPHEPKLYLNNDLMVLARFIYI